MTCKALESHWKFRSSGVTLSREEKTEKHLSCAERPGNVDKDINKMGRGRKLPSDV